MYVLLEIERMGHRLHDGHTNHVWMSYAYSVASMQHSTVVRNQCNLHYLHTTTYVTKFAKRGLIHPSNFSTLKICNLASTGSTALKFGNKTFLSLY